MKFAGKLNLNSSSWGILVPHPGTKVWEWFNSEEVNILGDWKKGFHIGFFQNQFLKLSNILPIDGKSLLYGKFKYNGLKNNT